MAQFVALTAEIETVRWYDSYEGKPAGVRTGHWTTRCIVGTNSWVIEQQPSGIARYTWWFNGSNILAQTLLLSHPSDRIELFKRNHPDIVAGGVYSQKVESRNGAPTHIRPLTVDLEAARTEFVTIPWMAFCSAPYLKSGSHEVPLPSIEYQTMGLFHQSEDMAVFHDGLGLPIGIEIYATNHQPVLEYRTLGSTNVLGWNFPLEFHLAQYRQDYEDGAWKVHMTATGKLTRIAPGQQPEMLTKEKEVLQK